jgi:hypothetical protein
MGQTVLRNAQTLFATFGDGVVKTDTLDEATIAANALVSHNNVKKRTGFRAAAGESDNDHDESFGWLVFSTFETRAKGHPACDTLKSSPL